MPSFSGMDYYQIMDTYKITPIQYGYINVITTIVSILGIFIYQIFLKHHELKTLTYWSCGICVFCYTVDLLQALRINIEWGISDFATLCFAGSVGAAIMFPLSFLPCLVMF